MKNIILALVALLLVTGLTYAQPNLERSVKYMVPLVQNETDTIPGTESGGLGNGKVGWMRVDGDDVYLTYSAVDSVQVNLYVDYADSGYSPGTGTSSYAIPFGTVAVAAGDTLNSAAAASKMGIVVRTIRNPITNSIGGARYVRFRAFALNNANFAGLASDRVIRVTVLRIKR